jgi:hypothetical protein
LEPNGQIAVKVVLYGGTVLYGSDDTIIMTDRNLDRTVRGDYGRYRNYGPKTNFTGLATTHEGLSPIVLYKT